MERLLVAFERRMRILRNRIHDRLPGQSSRAKEWLSLANSRIRIRHRNIQKVPIKEKQARVPIVLKLGKWINRYV